MFRCPRPRAVAAVAAITLSIATQTFAANWESLPSMPVAKGDGFGVLWNGAAYVVGGPPWMNGGDQDGSVYRFSGNAWSGQAPMNGVGPFVSQGGGIDGLNRLVFFGGVDPSSGDGGPTMTYDPVNGAATVLASRPASAPKQGFGFATDDLGRLYSLGGGNGAGATASSLCMRYTATSNSWSTLAPLPAAVSQTCAAYDGEGHIYVFGGFNANGSARTADVQRYDIASNTWSNTNTPDMPVAISHARAVLGSDHRIYVVGGIDASGTVRNATLVFDLWANTWSSGPSMSTARERPAVMAGDDSHIYVFGGHGVGGVALSTAETLYTPECPTITGQPEDATGWYGIPVGFQVIATGGTPLTYQWRRNGEALADGPMPTGGVVSGATSATLGIANASEADNGEFDVVVSTPCGSETSGVVHFALLPAPRVPTHWTVKNLHPSWADGSYLNAIDGATQVGGTYLPFESFSTIDRPTMWHGSAESAVNVTPPGSAGGEILGIEGDECVGWWWWPYSCSSGSIQYTCYSMEAAEWIGANAEHVNLQVSGWEFSEVTSLTNGVRGGYVWTDDVGPDTYTFNAGVWLPPNNTFVNVQPAWTWRSIIEAADGGHEYGWIFRNDVFPAHAAQWTGSAASCIDMNPAGESRSLLYGAGDGQQVGITGQATAVRAGVWGGSAAAFRSLHPANAASSAAFGCDGGFQVGSVSTSAATHAALWAGSPESMVDLSAFLDGYTGAYAYDVDVAADGTVRVVGTAYSATALRWEAIMWESTSAILGDLNGDGSVNGADLAILLGAWGTSDPAADLDQNGGVDGADLAMLLGAWR